MADNVQSEGPSHQQNETELEKIKDKVTSRLQKRDDERVAELQKKKEERESSAAANESSDFFTETFSKAKREVDSQLEASHSVEKASLSEHFDQLLISVQKMQRFLTDSTMFLTSFEVQKSQETINKLQTSVQQKRDELFPKKKFAFKSKKKTTTSEKPVVTSAVKKTEVTVEMTDCRFADETGKNLSKNALEINQKDVALTRLSDCVIVLKGSPSAVHISNLKNCKVFCGPVSGSVFIDACSDCTFLVPCQQLRIHSTSKSHFYIHVTSKAIIEDCKEVFFAPYNLDYPELSSHYDISGLDKTRNNWNDVDDFNWLASDTHSPNWKVLSADDRVLQWDLPC